MSDFLCSPSPHSHRIPNSIRRASSDKSHNSCYSENKIRYKLRIGKYCSGNDCLQNIPALLVVNFPVRCTDS